jgi:hypothetical protein
VNFDTVGSNFKFPGVQSKAMNAVKPVAWLACGVLLALSVAGCNSGSASEKYYSSPVDLSARSPSRVAAAPASAPSSARFVPAATPPLPPAEGRISGVDLGYAEKELPALLGNLWYPEAKISACSHSQRSNGAWTRVTLVMPSDEKTRDIINYYEVRYPTGERKGNDEYTFTAERPGDHKPVRVQLLRATDGSEATRFVARIGG